MDNTHLEIRNLDVHYGDNHVLQGVNLRIPAQGITALIGPSGCGKTTLLRCMNRLLERTADTRIDGQVLVDGEDIYAPDVEVTHLRRRMGLLAQRPHVLPMSIFDNVAYGPRIHGERNRAELARIVEHYLRMAGLWEEVKDRLSRPASGLSVGQQQRLCLARGLAVEPSVILCDEPTSALDPQSSRTVEQCLRELKERYTVILVTHILRQARRIADHVVFMYMGRIVEHGPAPVFFEQPREELTRQYLSGVFS